MLNNSKKFENPEHVETIRSIFREDISTDEFESYVAFKDSEKSAKQINRITLLLKSLDANHPTDLQIMTIIADVLPKHLEQVQFRD
jgi:hypothetical protein